MDVSDQLRTAIRKSGISANELSRSCGVPQPTITRFLAGAEARASTIDKLAAYFGLTLQPAAARPRKPKRKA
jgi:plasmid maintenance system antidote protein VapI